MVSACLDEAAGATESERGARGSWRREQERGGGSGEKEKGGAAQSSKGL